ncbi:DUF493 domain-containing protein [Hanstruepera neustonica]|uniref:DUF493 domain-containing protein n=1 Tax=Hanstruepera neustonica TaxID=1445657 RepID=A0A2K1DXT4_9FLAO|nr:DUF493 family protein [Hanstruepera neustonica]PNQ72838.1 DUF493 domain-containing protein [Hanstruepera neustonica]
MSEENKERAFYEKLKIQLYETSSWPTEYLFKFIVVTDSTGIQDVENLFNGVGAVITTKASKNGKYTSVSIHVNMKNPEAVVAKYIEVSEKVEGIISL